MTEMAYVALGSNLNQPLEQLRLAYFALNSLPKTQVIDASSVYLSVAIGPPQPDYLNAVLALQTALSPKELLAHLHEIELNQGRLREVHWGARTLDLDLLLHGQYQMQSAYLTLPHPRLHERLFVLLPLCELAPHLMLTQKLQVQQACELCESGPATLWLNRPMCWEK